MKSTLPFSSSSNSLLRPVLFGALLCTCLGLADDAKAVSLAVSQVYDENTFSTNTVDSQAPGNSLTLAAFSTAVSTAFTNGSGGIINFDIPGNTQDVIQSTALEISYGLGKQFNITSNATYNIHQFSSLTAISGSAAHNNGKGIAASSTFTNIQDWSFDIGDISGGLPNEAITTLGFTLLSRNGFSQNVNVRWFIDGSASSVLTQTDGIASGGGADDTFFSYTAPTNSYISGFSVSFLGATGSVDRRYGIDDIGFITSSIVPEPSRSVFFCVALTGCFIRRRR